MLKTLTVEGYTAVKEAIQESNGSVYVLFGGSLDKDGKSWCPDCVKADPVVEKVIKAMEGDDITVIVCHVGERDYWKNQSNEFRCDPNFKLKCVPTLLKIGTPQRLEEDQCANEDLVTMLFEED